MRTSSRTAAVGLAVVVLVTGCGSSDDIATPNPASASTTIVPTGLAPDLGLTWLNNTGLEGPDEAGWAARLTRACELPVWEGNNAATLAAEFLEADDADLTSPSIARSAAQALWIMAISYCRDDVPQEAIDQGPPGL